MGDGWFQLFQLRVGFLNLVIGIIETTVSVDLDFPSQWLTLNVSSAWWRKNTHMELTKLIRGYQLNITDDEISGRLIINILCELNYLIFLYIYNCIHDHSFSRQMVSVESCLKNLHCGQNDAILQYAWSGIDDAFNYLCGEAADGRSLHDHAVNSCTIRGVAGFFRLGVHFCERKIEGAKRPRIEGEARVEGAKRPKVESEGRIEDRALDKTGEGSGEGARWAPPQKNFEKSNLKPFILVHFWGNYLI